MLTRIATPTQNTHFHLKSQIILVTVCVAVTQQNRQRVRLENIPDITNMTEGGERKLGFSLAAFLK